MALPRKRLDDWEFDDFVAAALNEIPRLTDRWTDFNASDPGITLTELFSWLLAAQLFHLDQLTDRHRRAFLRLIGFEPVPPEAAAVWFSFNPDGAEPAVLRLPACAPLAPLERVEGFSFETREATALTLVKVERITRNYRNVEGEEVPPNSAGTAGAWLFVDDPRPGDGFDVELTCPASPAGWVSLYVELAGAPAGRLPPDSVVFTPPHFVWEYWGGEGAEGEWKTIPAVTLVDETYKLTRTGVLAFEVGEGFYVNAVGDLGRIKIRGRLRDDKQPATDGGVYFQRTPRLARIVPNAIRLYQRRSVVRCVDLADGAAEPLRVAAPAGNVPRLIVQRRNSDDGTWRDLPDSSYEVAPEDGLGVAKVLITDGESGELRVVVEGYAAPESDFPARLEFPASGLPDFAVDLYEDIGKLEADEEILPGLKIQVAEDAAHPRVWADWEEIEDLRLAGKYGRRFSLTADRRRVVFGDGEHGRVPPKASPGAANVRIVNLVATSGATGRDLPVAAIPFINGWKARPVGLDREGRKAEPLEEAIWRAREALRGPATAVTLADYADFARAAPGVEVARAEAVVRGAGGSGEANLVMVVVIPRTDRRPPEASEAFLQTIRAYVENFRTVTTRVEVARPQYVEILFDVAVGVAPGHDAEVVAAAVAERVRHFFDPLEGGEGGAGWPLGRSLYRSEAAATARETPGVSRVARCSFRVKGADPAAPAMESLDLPWNGLPLVRDVSVEVVGGGEVCPR